MEVSSNYDIIRLFIPVSMPSSKAKYFGLFPRAWTVYEEPVPGINIILRQVSPVIPNSYSDSSLPTAVFVAEVENIGDGPATVSVMFSFENSNGEDEKQGKNKPHAGFVIETPSLEVQGVCMSRLKGYKAKGLNGRLVKNHVDQCSLSIASTLKDSLTGGLGQEDSISVCRKFVIHEKFQTSNTAKELWDRFVQYGEISSFPFLDSHNEHAEVGSAVCVKRLVAPRQKKNYSFAVAWYYL